MIICTIILYNIYIEISNVIFYILRTLLLSNTL